MLDDTTMEKKNTGRSSATYKGSCSDTKVKPDVPQKQQGRSSWKRGNGRQQDAPRKPNPQRSRCVYDKRPMPRGAPSYPEDPRSEVARSLQDQSVDTVKKGNKKVNLNHLLNFTFAPRENADHHHYYRTSYDGRGGQRTRCRLPKYNKEQFLQANCQFVVRDGGSYGQHCSDADTLVDWGLVEEVRTGAFEDATCPICLYPPVAAKMTRCGHVYCWPCLLHYLSLTDHSWRRCPICYEAIHRDDLKSVVTEARTLYRRGDKITMCLMRRERNCMFPVPQRLWTKGIVAPLNLSDDKTMTCYQKLLTANMEQVEAILNREEQQLLQQLTEEGETPEACFVEAALQALGERRQSLQNHVMASNLVNDFVTLSTSDVSVGSPDSPTSPLCDVQLDQEKNVIIGPPQNEEPGSRQRCISSGSSEGALDFVISAEDLELAEPECLSQGTTGPNQGPKDSYYFYQSVDGQAIFLHALNVKMLVRDYGSLEQCPPLFEAEIVDIEGASIDANLRQRLRYLRHVPLTCEIKVVELKLESPLVTAETQQHFRQEIERRCRLRSKRAREERKRDRYLVQEELKRQGCYPAARFNLNSPYQFPSHNGSPPDAPAVGLPGNDANAVSSPSASDLDDRQSLGSALSNTADDDVMEGTPPKVSFAQMLQCKNISNGHSDVARGRRASRPPQSCSSSGHPDSESEDHVPVPSFHQSFSLALQDAFDNMDKSASPAAEARGSGRKKNKKNKTLLFSTFMNRSK
ncbi:E3 ubiquitin-protein ligase RNF10-like isoform X2 [Ornithodoros turicata]|uniref:E3 ubiquitin-protein ligase RNF10-like isoform X2 n=1 Tax=Ornithodoros turicata TaxID=34597 RepID=UPI003138A5A8